MFLSVGFEWANPARTARLSGASRSRDPGGLPRAFAPMAELRDIGGAVATRGTALPVAIP